MNQAATAAVFLFWVVTFVIVERFWPGRLAVNRRRELGLDVVAFLLVSVAAGGSQQSLIAATRVLHVGVSDTRAWFAGIPWGLRVVVALVLMDLGLYVIHRAMHATNLLWPTHRWHHSVEELYWFSGLRTSALHALLYAVPQVAVLVFVLRLDPKESTVAAVFGGFGQFYIHSSTDVGLGPLSWLFITPRYHRLHHASGATQGKNLGTFLTIWDRMFGTFVDPDRTPAPETLGLAEKPSLLRMLIGV